MVDTSWTPLLSAEGLEECCTAESGMLSRSADVVRAIGGVSFQLFEGETLGLVGESGCGKPALGRQLVGLEHPIGGRVVHDDRDLGHMSQAQMRPFRTQLQIIFQDSYSSLNPRKHVFEILAKPVLYHELTKRRDICSRVRRLLDMVGFPKNCLGRYPYEFSNGQRQCIGITRALSLSPKLLVCDEPVSALDVSIQAQILNLLGDSQKGLGFAYIFIGHRLGAMNYINDRIATIYLGKIVEIVDWKELLDRPLHPYSRALFETVPIADPRKRRKRSERIVGGETALNVNTPSRCPLYPRCPRCKGKCMNREMELRSMVSGNSHLTTCTWFKELEKEDGEV